MADMTLMDINSIVDAENANPPSFSETEKMASLSAEEVVAINKRIAEVAENPDVFGVLWNARQAIYNAVRIVKKNVHQDFKGFEAEGDELDLIIIRPQDVLRDGTALETFTTSVSATGVSDFESDTGGAEVTLSEEEARVYCGWIDPVDSPKSIGVMIQKGRSQSYIIPTPFKMCKDYPVIQHVPVIIKPKDSYKIQVRYNAIGTDALEPVGVRIVQAKSLNL